MSGISCEAFETYREQIQLFTDGCLSEQETQKLKQHCLTCPACAAYLREMVALREALKGTLEEIPPSELHMKIIKSLTAEKRHKTAPLRRFGIAAAAVLVLAIGTVAFLKSPLSPIAQNTKSADMAESAEENLYAAEYDEENDGLTSDDSYENADSEVDLYDNTSDSNASDVNSAVDSTTSAASAVDSTAVTTAVTTVAMTTAAPVEPFEEYSDTMDKKTLSLVREHLDEWTKEALSGSETASFVEVVHLEMIPVELEYDDYRAAKFGVEDVNVILTFGTEDELGGMIEAAYPDWVYKTNDTTYISALDTFGGTDNGLFVILVPSGT